MANTFNGTVTFGIVASYSKASDLTTLTEAINYTNTPVAYTNGTGSYQVNGFYSDTRTLNGSENFDLDAGTVTDGFNYGLVFSKVKVVFFKNRSTTTAQTLTLTGDFLTQAGVGVAALGVVIGPGGSFLLDNPIDGYTVTAASADVITPNTSVSLSYDIVLLGVVT